MNFIINVRTHRKMVELKLVINSQEKIKNDVDLFLRLALEETTTFFQPPWNRLAPTPTFSIYRVVFYSSFGCIRKEKKKKKKTNAERVGLTFSPTGM